MRWQQLVAELPEFSQNEKTIEKKWLEATAGLQDKIIVLDDDPTGVQTIHSLPVYTDWEQQTIEEIIKSQEKVTYILTNSRSLLPEETCTLHQEVGKNLVKIAKRFNQKFIVISRSDSTLRGHYPLETEILYEQLSQYKKIDGEIIIPFFKEGGRITYRDIHYVREKDELQPVGKTEFASDSTFGYHASNLKEWIEEKTDGNYLKKDVKSVPLKLLRENRKKEVLKFLMETTSFNKVIINAVDYKDLKIFIPILIEALNRGKYFLFRSAASFVRIMGGIKEKPLLSVKEMITDNTKPGLIIVGSYVQKSTDQLNKLRKLSGFTFIEWDVRQAQDEVSLIKETARVKAKTEASFKKNKDTCIYTTRTFVSRNDVDDLVFSNRVSQGLVKLVKDLSVQPSYIIAKGGVTASNIGVKALQVKKANVLGQIRPGVPVWRLGPESKYPGLPYVIFPGNVGDKNDLKHVVENLRQNNS